MFGEGKRKAVREIYIQKYQIFLLIEWEAGKTLFDGCIIGDLILALV